MNTLYDISHPLHPGLAVWPGDVGVSLEPSLRIAAGESVNLQALRLSLHAGTHVDAPWHFLDAGATIDHLPLAPFLGPARVAEVAGVERIGQRHLEHLDLSETPRLLLRTGGWPSSAMFPGTIPVLETEAIDWLAAQGVVLLGLDLPSVDELESKALPNHHRLHRHGIAILESLRLDHVPEGCYELIALPLAVCGGDASPVRAVLRSL